MWFKKRRKKIEAATIRLRANIELVIQTDNQPGPLRRWLTGFWQDLGAAIRETRWQSSGIDLAGEFRWLQETMKQDGRTLVSFVSRLTGIDLAGEFKWLCETMKQDAQTLFSFGRQGMRRLWVIKNVILVVMWLVLST